MSAEEMNRRTFLRRAGLTAAAITLAACAPRVPGGNESVPSPVQAKPTPVPPQKDTSVPTPEKKETIPTPTWGSETEVSFLPGAGGKLIAGELIKADNIQPEEANNLTDNQKLQLNDALSMGRLWTQDLISRGYGDKEGLKLCVAFGKTNAFAVRVEKAGSYPQGTLFVEGKDGVLTIEPFSKTDEIKALGDKEGSFKGWASFDDKGQLIARVDRPTNRWMVGPGESEEYWLPKLGELGMDLSSIPDPKIKAAIAETAFYSLQATYGADFEWEKVKKGEWMALFISERESAKILLFDGDKVFERKYESEWGRQFDVKDKDGNWVGAWLTRPLENVPSGKIGFKENKLQVIDETKGTYTFDWEKHEWELIPKAAEATPEPAASSTPVPAKEATPAKEEPREYVTWSTIEGYTTPNGKEIGTVVPGKHFTILEEQGDWIHIRLEAGGEGWIKKSETAYGLVGAQPPERATPEPSKRFPKEIVLANGQLVIDNKGAEWGVAVSDGGFLDAGGNYCPGGGLPCEGKKGYDTGMRTKNEAYVNAMFTKYNTSGKILKIFFYDDINKFPYRNEGQVNQNFYRYGREAGNTIELHIGVYPTFNPRDQSQIDGVSFQLLVAGIGAFLQGDYDAITKNSVPKGFSPQELVAIAYDAKFDIVG